jgi:hypothetical protein
MISTGGGFKLWIDSKLILEAKESYPESYTSRPIALEAGKKYDIKLEFSNTDSRTGIGLLWESKSLPEEYVPQSQLYAGVNAPPAPVPANQPPFANAGSDIIVTLPITTGIVLNGTATDADGNIQSYQWSKISGPSSVHVSDYNVASPTVSNLEEGTYIFRLTVTDNNNATATDDIQVTVNPAAKPANKSTPVVSAGGNQIITLPVSSVNLNGAGSDPDGNNVSFKWTKISGNSANMVNDTSASAMAANLKAGVYVFRLTVTAIDGTSVFDDVEVTVNNPTIHQNNDPNDNGNNDPGQQNNPNPGQQNNPGGEQQAKSNDLRNEISPTLEIIVHPNPSSTNFRLQLKSTSRGNMTIHVYNRWGKQVDTFSNVGVNSTLTIGDNYPLGFYYVHLKQGAHAKIVRLLKVM